VARDTSKAEPGRRQWLSRRRFSQKLFESADGRPERRKLAALSRRRSAGLNHHTHHLARRVKQRASELVFTKARVEDQRVF
jgi:hypothetical protein